MKTIEQIAAEILVEAGFIKSYSFISEDSPDNKYIADPFADTLEGRRQADAIEDWLYSNHYKLWGNTPSELDEKANGNHHQWRLDRIKWCLERFIP